MTTNKASSVKLSKTNKYCTYQLYAEMANKNTNLDDGLKYAILKTLEWLRKRLGDSEIPKELLLPDASKYKKIKNEEFKSFSINEGYTIIVVTDIDLGIWALRIIENDSGLIDKKIAPVPGRTIQSDIAYRIVNNKLECAFKTTVYDPTDVEKAKCIRFGLIKVLANDQIFGLKQKVNLYNPNRSIIGQDNIEVVKELIRSDDNQLPLIIYLYNDNQIDLKEISTNPLDLKIDPSLIPSIKTTVLNNPVKKAIDVLSRSDAYANRYCGFAYLYFLPKKYFKQFATLANKNEINENNVLIYEPKCFGGKAHVYDYEDKDSYVDFILQYSREKNIDYKDVLFVDETLLLLQDKRKENENENIRLLGEAASNINQLQSRLEKGSRLIEYSVSATKNNDKEEELIEELNKQKGIEATLRTKIERLTKELSNKDEYIEYLERKQLQPTKHKEIANWCDEFEHVVLDRKAIDCLESNSASSVDVEVICDALDYLEYAYAKYLFNEISSDELQEVANKFYKRPYNVTPSGIPISARGDCKIKVALSGESKRRERVLDQHLKIGGHGENLLRIYFIVDKEARKIIVGSLPNHLEY